MKELIKKYEKIIRENYAAGAVHYFGENTSKPYDDDSLNAAFSKILSELLEGGDAGEATGKLYELLPLYNDKTEPFGNWWFWEIGIPRSLNQIFTLIYDTVPAELLAEYMSAQRHFHREIILTGANRLWECEIFALRGILCGNEDEINMAKTQIAPILKTVSEGDGFYEDGSFIQHKNIPYNGGYGLSLLAGLSDMLALFGDIKGTENIGKIIEKAFLPFMYRGIFMDMVRGREMSRYYSTAQSAYKKAEHFIRRLYGDTKIKNGFYYFKAMDRAVMRRDDFAAGLAMHSKRSANFESINNENQTAWHTSDGMLYLYTDPFRFSGAYFPCVDMERLPGTTVIRGIYPKPNFVSTKDLCAGKMFGENGVCAMDINDIGKKAWFFLGDIIVCLGADMTGGSETIIENILLHEDAEVSISDRQIYVKSGKNDCGLCIYIPDGDIKVIREIREGGWENVSSNTDKKRYCGEFLTLIKEHKTKGEYAYMLFPAHKEPKTDEIIIKSNCKNVQSVIYKQRLYEVSRKRGEIKICMT
ncbi:MAG: polysaccharide lyase family 8 super-sandwich domain-containing protein [Clostridiales bacterium]|nr:polysaccharide lyase family 8 super-sandwich domain-containing protein [Clostridiales bacterium]